MYDDLALTLNAQFYRANENASDADFEAILDAAVENAFPGSIMVDDLRIAVGRGRNRYRYSLRVFKARRPVYFFATSTAGGPDSRLYPRAGN